MDSNRLKAIIDLHDYLDTIGEDRPPVGVFFERTRHRPENNVRLCYKHHTQRRNDSPRSGNRISKSSLQTWCNHRL